VTVTYRSHSASTDNHSVHACAARSSLFFAGGLAPVFDGGKIPMTYVTRTTVNTATGQLVDHKIVEGLELMSLEHPHVSPAVETTKDAR
jgi:hypothetical protein